MEGRYIILVIFCFLNVEIWACDCIDSIDIQSSYSNSDVVLIGRVINYVDSTNIIYNTINLGYADIYVEKIYKGECIISTDIRIPIFNFKSSCDFIFEENNSYLIFGIVPKKGRFIFTDKCMGNMEVSELLKENILFLENKYHEIYNSEDTIEIER